MLCRLTRSMCCKNSYPELNNVFDELQIVCPAMDIPIRRIRSRYISQTRAWQYPLSYSADMGGFVKLNQQQFWLIHHTSASLTSSLTNSYIIHNDT
jgi:hypothetical protein